jgi:hypothetical protein
MTYEAKRGSAVAHKYKGKHVLIIHLLKAEQHEAVQLPSHGLLVSDDVNAPEWVIYQYHKAHPIHRWLPSKFAKWLAEKRQAELAIAAKQGACFTFAELNQILATVLVFKSKGEHLRTWIAALP